MTVRSSERLFLALDRLIDRQVGIIHDVEEVPREAGAPALFYYYARSCNTRAFCDQTNFGDGGGASTDRLTALAKAVGESVERYCSAIYDKAEFPLSSFRDAPFSCVPPQEFALYRPEQYSQKGFPFRPFLEDTKIRWARTIEPLTGNAFYVPAAMVYVPYVYDEQIGETPVCQPISTGLACHGSFAEAATSAICEVVERDAFAISWQARLGRTRILTETLSEHNLDLVDRLQANGSQVVLLNMTMDTGIPTIFAAATSNSAEAPALVCAAATHLDPEQAARKCLEEVAHTRVLAQALKSSMPAPQSSPDDYDKVVDQDGHIRFYGEHHNADLASFLFSSPFSIRFRDIKDLSTRNPEQDLGILIRAIHGVSHRVLLSDLTTADVAKLGLAVVRAIIPGFHPLFLGHRIRALGGTRLWSLPQALGYKGISPVEGDNPAPHPYP